MSKNEYAEELKVEERDNIQKGVIFSFALHAFIISVFTLKAVFFTDEPLDFSSAVRVDIVGLPDKIDPDTILPPKSENPSPAKPQEKKPIAKEEPVAPDISKSKELPTKKDKEAINLEKTKSQQNAALNKLKAMSALEKIKSDVAKEKSDKAQEQVAQDIQIKGNVINPGTSLTGLDKIQHENYLSELERHIKTNWSLPEWLSKQDLKAQVQVNLDSKGMLVAKKLLLASGNTIYDEYVLETIEKSVPFPHPPEKLTAILEVKGVRINFP